MSEIYKDLIYLLTCAVNSITPDQERVQNMDLSELYKISSFLSMDNVVNIALEKAHISDEPFQLSYKKALRKSIMHDAEKTAILAEFEKNGIWYMPLKGAIVKDFYPESGMRQMTDMDILFDKEKQEQVKDIMLSRGYTVKSQETSNHDVYTKKPLYDFEMHKDLFKSFTNKNLYQYYVDVKKRLIKDSNNQYGYHFSDEDFYVFITAHEWKHYHNAGIGIRYLLDCYVFLKAKEDKLDFLYIAEQLKTLGIADYEEKRRNLAKKIFSSVKTPQLTEKEFEMLKVYFSSGTNGTFDNFVKFKLKEQGKFSFMMHRIFLPRSIMAKRVPFTAKSPLLYPFGVLWRSAKILLFRRDKIKVVIRKVKEYDKQKI